MSSAGIERTSGTRAYMAHPNFGHWPNELHANRMHLEVTSNANGPGELARREALAERRTEALAGVSLGATTVNLVEHTVQQRLG
jgi:hypothetical protein